MTTKRSKIILLKEKVAEMQNELEVLEKSQQTKKPCKPQTKIALSPQRNTYKNSEFKNPNFWTSNPINHDDTYSPKRNDKSTSPTNRSLQRQRIERQYSPILKNILNTVDNQYYNSLKQHQPKETHELRHFYETAYTGKRFQNSYFGMTRPSPTKEDKKKTFEKKKTDTILNPETPKPSYRKIVNTIERSPEKMLVENEKSNPNMYFYSGKPIILERKGGLQYKNKSSLGLVHCESQLLSRPRVEGICGKRKKSQKKHFAKYFEDTLFSHV